MRIVHLSVSDKENGAHLAGYRVHKGLLRLGVDSTMFVQRRLDDSGDNTIQVYQRPRNLFFRAKTRAYRYWIYRDLANYPERMASRFLIVDRAAEGRHVVAQMPPADVIFIHAAYDFIDYYRDVPVLAERAHVVFVLHDMSFFTGGCTHDLGCGRFTDRCGACPILLSHNENDPTRHVWERKQAVFARIRNRLHFVAPSRWIASEAKRSSLLRDFPIEVIPHGIDTDVFRQRDHFAARELLGIPRDARVLLFAAQPVDSVDKGFPFLTEALRQGNDRDLFLLIAGGGKLPAGVPIPHRHLGRIHDELLMALAYSAADVFVMPSLRETFGATAIEAMASGTPVIAFATGGITETVRHGECGLLVPPENTRLLYKSIEQILRDSDTRTRMAENGRRIAVEEYSTAIEAKRYAAYSGRLAPLLTGTQESGLVRDPRTVVRPT